jgi:hypothetical protein
MRALAAVSPRKTTVGVLGWRRLLLGLFNSNAIVARSVISSAAARRLVSDNSVHHETFQRTLSRAT